jgi:hypothetical protein
MFERKVFLKLWVKVREGWVDDENMLEEIRLYGLGAKIACPMHKGCKRCAARCAS